MAQIAITALSLSNLSQTHWVARGFFAFSLTSSLCAVVYAATQHIIMSHLLTAKQVRTWIRGGAIITYIDPFTFARAVFESMIPFAGPAIWVFWFSNIKVFRPCEPEELQRPSIDLHNETLRKYSIMRQCFTPGVTSVITMSAPVMLLATSVLSIVVAFGIYFAFTWTRNLDVNAGPHDSRNVFIMYIAGLGFCLFVYSVSQLIQDEIRGDEYMVIERYFDDYETNHAGVAQTWKLNQGEVGQP